MHRARKLYVMRCMYVHWSVFIRECMLKLIRTKLNWRNVYVKQIILSCWHDFSCLIYFCIRWSVACNITEQAPKNIWCQLASHLFTSSSRFLVWADPRKQAGMFDILQHKHKHEWKINHASYTNTQCSAMQYLLVEMYVKGAIECIDTTF